MAFERRKKAVQDNLSGVIPKGSLTPGSEAWESHSRSLSPLHGMRSLSSLESNFHRNKRRPRTSGGGTVKNSSMYKHLSSQFRDSGPMTVSWAKGQLELVRSICNRIVSSTGGLVECIVIAELKCIGGRTEVVEAPLKSNELARAVWHHPAAMRLRSKLLAQHLEIPGIPSSSELNGTTSGFGDAKNPGESIELLTSVLAAEAEWPTNEGGLIGTGDLSGEHEISYGAERQRIRSSKHTAFNDSNDAAKSIRSTKYPIIDDWRTHFMNESISFESVSLWAELKLTQLPKSPADSHIRLAGVCELLWLITERAITRYAPLMRLFLCELRANLYIEYSTQSDFAKAPKGLLSSDGRMDSAHLLHLTPFSRLYSNIRDQMDRMKAIIEQSRDEEVVAIYRRKAIEYTQKMALRAFMRLLIDKWRNTASYQKQVTEQENLIGGLRDVIQRQNGQLSDLRAKIHKLEESKESNSEAAQPKVGGNGSSRNSAAAPPPQMGKGRSRRRQMTPQIVRPGAASKPVTCTTCDEKPASLCTSCVELSEIQTKEKLATAQSRIVELEVQLQIKEQLCESFEKKIAGFTTAASTKTKEHKEPTPMRTTEDIRSLIKTTASVVAANLAKREGIGGSLLLKRLKPKLLIRMSEAALIEEWADIISSKAFADENKFGVAINENGSTSKYLQLYYTLKFGKGNIASRRLSDMLISLKRECKSNLRLSTYATLCGINPTTCHTFTKTLAELCCLWYRYILRSGDICYAGEKTALLTSRPGEFLVEHKLIMRLVRPCSHNFSNDATSKAMYSALELLLQGYSPPEREVEISILREKLLNLPDIKDERTHFKNFVDMDLVYDTLVSWHHERAEREQGELVAIYREVDNDMNGHLTWDEALELRPKLAKINVSDKDSGLLLPVPSDDLEKIWEAIDLDDEEDESSDAENDEQANQLARVSAKLNDIKFSIGAWASHLRLHNAKES